MYCTGEARLVKRNGEWILQQKWADGFTLDEPKPPEWRDVPWEPEQPKTERQRVCDEIAEFVLDYQLLYTENDLRIMKTELIAFINRIKDKK